MIFSKDVLINTIFQTMDLTGAVIAIGLLLGLISNSSIKNFQRSFGQKSLMITGIIGVPIHELSHAVFALLFKHKIKAIKLIQKPDENGVMGYVQHNYNTRSIYQQIGNFFIGIAPLLGGTITIMTLMKSLIPNTYNNFIDTSFCGTDQVISNRLLSYLHLMKGILSFENLSSLNFYIFLFIAICIASHMSLSPADIKGASSGLVTIFIMVLVVNILGVAKFLQIGSFFAYNKLVVSFLLISLIFSLISYIISLICILIRKHAI